MMRPPGQPVITIQVGALLIANELGWGRNESTAVPRRLASRLRQYSRVLTCAHQE